MDTAREEQYKGTLRAARDKIRALADEADVLKRKLAVPGMPVAIVGMAGEFPGSGDNAESFRQMLLDGIDATREIPATRWDHERYYSPVPGECGKYYCTRASFIKRDPFSFDHEFFGLSPAEAEMMDPQQRALLTQSHHALEDAGISPSSIRGTDTGVFLGISSYDYLMSYATPDINERSDPYTLTGSSFNSAAGHLSYYYDIHGPCIAFDTACSSSLVAVMGAVEALRKGECPIALAGGVNLLISPLSFVALCSIRALSADGICRAFGEGATGFGRGEGCGIVVLKRIDDARADGDRIHALILGGALGHDGQSAGFTAPSGIAQQRIIERAMRDAGVLPGDVAYVETHGTGTDIGDPIEATSLFDVFGHRTSKLLIGSVKSNIGHLEAAAGVASLFKAVFTVRDDVIPPSINAESLSTRIEWPTIDIDVCRECTPWPAGYERKIAGISSFGISGTGAHILIAEPPVDLSAASDTVDAHDFPDWRVLPVSAKNPESLISLVSRYTSLFENENIHFHHICDAAALERDHYSHRVAVCAPDVTSARKALLSFSIGKRSREIVEGTTKNRIRIAFLFSGQGSQVPGMGNELYRTHQPFRDTINACEKIASERIGRSLLDVMFGDDDSLLKRTLFTQPAIYAMGVALTDMWRSFGIRPSAVIGHSIGDYAAAYAAGVLTLEEGMEIVIERARLADSIETEGMMAAVLTDEMTARDFLIGTNVDIAAVNGDDNITISGQRNAVSDILARMRIAGIEFREMPVSQAFHSQLIDPVLGEFRNFLNGHRFDAPKIQFVSAMNASELTDKTEWPVFWTEQMRRTVRFKDALAAIADIDICLEIGASPTLTSLCRTVTENCQWLFSQGPTIPAWKQVSLTLARLYTAGCDVDFTGGIFRRSVGADIPLYPFRETVLHPPKSEMGYFDTQTVFPDVELPDNISSSTAKRIMEMQITSMKRLFKRQLETLGNALHEEPESHE